MLLSACRSLLFVPATATAFVAKAHERGADAVIIDLEDSILEQDKPHARLQVTHAAQLLSQHRVPVILRVNADPLAWQKDLQAIDVRYLHAVMLPKVESAAHVQAVCTLLDELEIQHGVAPKQIAVVALIETPLGVIHCAAIASASERLCALGFGAEDYATAMSIAPEPDSLKWAAQQISNAAHAFDLACWGLIESIANFNDLDRLRASARDARRLGFTGSVAIHPRQVAIFNDGFSPSPDELAWAKRVIDGAEQGKAEGKGVVVVDGRMVDQPLVLRAQRWLSQASNNALRTALRNQLGRG